MLFRSTDRNDFEECELHYNTLVGDNDLRNFGQVCSDSMYADRSFCVPHHCSLVRGSLVYVMENDIARPGIFLKLSKDSVLDLSGDVKIGKLVRVREGVTPQYVVFAREAREYHFITLKITNTSPTLPTQVRMGTLLTKW